MAKNDGIVTQTNNNTITTKARYWVGVLYPENMRSDWQECIGEILQLPYAYGIHDRDLNSDGTPRKSHVHLMIAFPNTTTYKSAMQVFNELSAPGQQALNTIQKINNVRYMYNYLIHDTDECRKKHKHKYPASSRVVGNNFDIGNYEQISQTDKESMRDELAHIIMNHPEMKNFTDFNKYVISNYGSEYNNIVACYSGYFERLTKGNFQHWRFDRMNGVE